jgi:hypothetical protein
MIPTIINRQAKPPEQNVQPGTVVDKGVMNAAAKHFNNRFKRDSRITVWISPHFASIKFHLTSFCNA